MTGYSTHWRATIFAAIIFHLLAALMFSYVLPQSTTATTISDATELEWIDVELSDEAAVIDTEAIPAETVQENSPTFDAKDLFVPELKIPEPIIEPIQPLPEVKPIEPIKPQLPPQPVQKEQAPASKVETEPAKEVAPEVGNQVVTRPPITVKAVYPEQGSGLGFKGYVSFAVHIGKDGKIKSTEILQSSGRYFVDEIARKAAEQWTFKPALDQIGRPMECDKIITFDFKKFS